MLTDKPWRRERPFGSRNWLQRTTPGRNLGARSLASTEHGEVAPCDQGPVPCLADARTALLQEIIDALPVDAAILDRNGEVVLGNGRWNLQATGSPDLVGASANPTVSGVAPLHAGQRDSRRISHAITTILSGARDEAVVEYTSSFGDPHRLTVTARPLRNGAILVDEDLSEVVGLRHDKKVLAEAIINSAERERRRIGREMHDSTLQDLVAIGLVLRQLTHLKEDDAAQQVFSEIRSILARAQQDVRTLSYLLHPPLLHKGGVALALRTLIEGLSSRMNVKVEFECEQSDIRLPSDVEIALYRVAQEGLINVHKHASATRVVVRFECTDRGVRLQIEDDGVGLGGGGRRYRAGSGVGVEGMRARVAHLHGRLTLTSRGGGTCLTVSIPAEQLV
jgi:two-component system, NarL family, sensor kinase